jgi:hypothetical protein
VFILNCLSASGCQTLTSTSGNIDLLSSRVRTAFDAQWHCCAQASSAPIQEGVEATTFGAIGGVVETPEFSISDVNERRRWKRYMAAYEDMIRNTSTDDAPWRVIPANNRWLPGSWSLRPALTLDGLDLKFPVVEGKALTEWKIVRRALLAERGSRHY